MVTVNPAELFYTVVANDNGNGFLRQVLINFLKLRFFSSLRWLRSRDVRAFLAKFLINNIFISRTWLKVNGYTLSSLYIRVGKTRRYQNKTPMMMIRCEE